MPIVPVTSAFPLLQSIDGSCSAQSVQGDPPDYDAVMARDKARRPTTLRLADVGNQPPPRGWRPVRDSGAALPPDHPYLLRPPCGVLPGTVMKELNRVLAKIDQAGLTASRKSEQAHLDLAQATATLHILTNLGPEPSAPAMRFIGGGLFADEDPGVDAARESQLKNAAKKVARIRREMDDQKLRHLKKMRALHDKLLRVQSKFPPAPPPANPPPGGYVPRH